MKKIILAATIAMFATSAFAGATLIPKDTKANGNLIGKLSSQATGNGDWVGGNGTGAGPYGANDQTTEPGSRADEVHTYNDAPGLTK